MTQPSTTSRSDGLLSLNNKPLDFAARAYASMGWPVLPLVTREKRPANENGLTGASTDLDQIDEWWQRWPKANIGLRTGDAFDVLDLDSKEAVETLQILVVAQMAEDGEALIGFTKYIHHGPIQSTGKGFHLLFEPTGARNFANRYPGIDFRGQRGYIVASPSIHPNGHQYRWVRDEPLPPPTRWLDHMLIPARTTAPSGIDPADLAPIVEAFNETLAHAPDVEPLQALGSRFITSCIFPDHEDSTPSFVLYPENNSFYCFGCQEWGDTIDLVTYATSGIKPSIARESRAPRAPATAPAGV